MLLSGVGLSDLDSISGCFWNVFGSGTASAAGDGIDSEYGSALWITVPPTHEEQPELIGPPDDTETLPAHGLQGVYEP